MKDKVIDVINMPKSEESIRLLCELCGIRDFQASDIIDKYKDLQNYHADMIKSGMDPSYINSQMQEILRNLISGEYAKPEVIEQDFKTLIINLLQAPITDESISKLSKFTNRDYDTIKDKINLYQSIQSEEMNMLKNHLDASMLTSQKWEIINELSSLNGSYKM